MISSGRVGLERVEVGRVYRVTAVIPPRWLSGNTASASILEKHDSLMSGLQYEFYGCSCEERTGRVVVRT
mgnify:FL=1